MRVARWVSVLAFAGLIATLGCFDRDLTDIRPVTTTGVTIQVEQVGVIRVDIVVLVDNSGSMSQEQAALVQRFPELITELLDPPPDPETGRPSHPPVEDLNIGVVSSDMGTAGHRVSTCSISDVGDNGCFRNTPSPAVLDCEATYPAYLARNDTNAGVYLPPDMAHDFACIATLGTQGCGFEQQFKAMRAAVTTDPDTGLCNMGFLRPDALLALIWVTDEEDCSVRSDHNEMFDPTRDDLGHLNIRCFVHPEFVESVEDYVAAFRALKPMEDQDKIVLGMIVGVPPDAPACIGNGDDLDGCLGVPAMTAQIDPTDPTSLVPSCNTSMGQAFPPRRFVAMAQAFGSSAIVDSICKTDWTSAIRGITDKLVERLPSTCFPRALTFDENACTADCKVVETLNNDRPCQADSGCTNCPPATIDDVHNLAPCTVSASDSTTCEPLKRDLGLVEGSEGQFYRQCLVRQATRTNSGTGCGAATSLVQGWYYLPTGAILADDPATPELDPNPPCPQVYFGDGSLSFVEDGSTAELRCLSELCPEDLQCGPENVVGQSPTIPCCAHVDFNDDRIDDPAHCNSAPGRASPGTCVPGECRWHFVGSAWVCLDPDGNPL
ncbi:MAG: hypothetical protein HY905_17280 [Deltaproteobacteria bacterium]|nr:hypothetical protein [Deltaproteobacteria bacterium]